MSTTLFEENDMKQDTALALPAQKQAIAPIELIQQAIAQGTPPEVIRELVALQQSMERFNWEREERQSKIDFDDALNECQKQIGRIAGNVKRNDTGSWWADYAELDRTVRPIYTEHGFAIGFSEVPPISPGKVRIKATLSRSGISKEFFREITPSTTGPKGGVMATATDADAIAGSRAKRYLILDIFNIAVGIDKDEKKGIPSTLQSLDERAHLTHLDNIHNAANRGELQRLYLNAISAAEAIQDAASIKAFISAKDKRMKELA